MVDSIWLQALGRAAVTVGLNSSPSSVEPAPMVRSCAVLGPEL